MRNTGKLFIISGPAGAGKDTVIKGIRKIFPDLVIIKSYTTRPRRESDEVGNRVFVSELKFKQMIKNSEFVEWAKVHSWFYGRRKKDIYDNLVKGKNIIIDADVQGAETYEKIMPEVISVFIKYSDISYFEKRLITNRPEITPKELAVRKNSLEKEMAYEKYYDYSIVNPEGYPEKAISAVAKIIKRYIIKK